MLSERVLPAFRGLALFAAISAAYFAQFIFRHETFADLFPSPLIDWFPSLNWFARWRTDGLTVAAVWLYLLAALSFGLVTPLWRGRQVRLQLPWISALPSNGVRWLVPTASAGTLIVAAILILRWAPVLVPLAYLCWVGAAVLYIWLGLELSTDVETSFSIVRERLDLDILRGWPWLAAVVVLAAVAYAANWLGSPATIDVFTAGVGQLAQGNADVSAADADIHALPALSVTVTAIWARLSGDGLFGVRMAGFYAGHLMVLAVWLLASELLAREPVRGWSRQRGVDDAVPAKTLAAAIAAFGLPTLFYARMPVVLEGVAWGSLGLWALLYAQRTKLLPLLAASAVLLAGSTFYGSNGLAFIGVGLSIWLGLLVLSSPNKESSVRALEGRLGFLFWLAGIALFLLPLVAGELGSRTELAAYLSLPAALDGARTSLFASIATKAHLTMGLAASDLQGAILAPSIASGASGMVGIDASMLSSLIAPFYLLGVGALLVSVDTLTGWTLGAWIFAGAALAVLFAQPAPAHWSSLLVLWPAVSLATAFGLARLGAAISTFVGDWTWQASLYLSGGLVMGAAILGWLTFYESAMRDIDSASAVGRELRRGADTGDSVVLLTAEPWSDDEMTVVSFLANERPEALEGMQADLDNLPGAISSPMRIIFPDDARVLDRISELYPGGTLHIYRDGGGNPVVYSYIVGR